VLRQPSWKRRREEAARGRGVDFDRQQQANHLEGRSSRREWRDKVTGVRWAPRVDTSSRAVESLFIHRVPSSAVQRSTYDEGRDDAEKRNRCTPAAYRGWRDATTIVDHMYVCWEFTCEKSWWLKWGE
jgi:hypothetical protein